MKKYKHSNHHTFLVGSNESKKSEADKKYDLKLKKVIIFEEFLLRIKYQTFLECVKNHYKFYNQKLTVRPEFIPSKNRVLFDNYLDVNGCFDKIKFDKIEESMEN